MDTAYTALLQNQFLSIVYYLSPDKNQQDRQDMGQAQDPQEVLQQLRASLPLLTFGRDQEESQSCVLSPSRWQH